MDDIRGVVCAFCGSIMRLSREIPASAKTHELRFFACETCGASEVRIHRSKPNERDRTRRLVRSD
jgi:hypothetical protein